MKRIICGIIILILILTVSSYVFAHDHSGNVAEMDIKYQYDEENGLLTVTAGLINITDPTGITDLEYDVHYDASCFGLKEYKVNMPSAWLPFTEEQMAEDLSRKKNDGLFMWAIMVFEESVAVTTDNELFLTLVFEVKKEKTSKIDFEYIYMVNGPLELVSGNSSEITVTFDQDESPSIDVSDSIPSVPDVSKEPEESEESENDFDGSKVNISDTDDTDNKPPVLGKPIVSQIVSDDDSTDNGNTDVGLYVGIVFVVVIVIIAAISVILVVRNKGKVK